MIKAHTKPQQHKSAIIEDSSRNILTVSTAVLNRWNEYCNGLYNYELHLDTSLLQSNQIPREEPEIIPVLRERLKRLCIAGKSPEVDSIPTELLKKRGEATTTVLTAICQKTWQTK